MSVKYLMPKGVQSFLQINSWNQNNRKTHVACIACNIIETLLAPTGALVLMMVFYILRHIGLLEADEKKIRKIRPKGTQVKMLYVPREAIRP